MVILGLDPSLTATGYGCIAARGGRLEFLAAGTIRPPARRPMAERLLHLHQELARVIDTHHPDTTAIEGIYTHYERLTTAALLAHARGVCCLTSAMAGVPVVDYLPTRVKKSLTGAGHASKTQVARAVEGWLGVAHDASWSSDATDALALAIAHAHISRARVGALVR